MFACLYAIYQLFAGCQSIGWPITVKLYSAAFNMHNSWTLWFIFRQKMPNVEKNKKYSKTYTEETVVLALRLSKMARVNEKLPSNLKCQEQRYRSDRVINFKKRVQLDRIQFSIQKKKIVLKLDINVFVLFFGKNRRCIRLGDRFFRRKSSYQSIYWE